MPRTQRQPKTQIYSIFGQCEKVAAEIMIGQGKLTKIPQDEIPESALYTDNPFKPGEQIKAYFAVVVPIERQAEFDELCKMMRA